VKMTASIIISMKLATVGERRTQNNRLYEELKFNENVSVFD